MWSGSYWFSDDNFVMSLGIESPGHSLDKVLHGKDLLALSYKSAPSYLGTWPFNIVI